MERVRKIIGMDGIYEREFRGSDITVAILDTGIARHIDFDHRVLCFKDFIYGKEQYYDDNGHGTHIAGIIGGSGAFSGGRFRGVAPECKFVICKVLNKRGDETTRHIIEGIRWCIKQRERYRIRILNISVGMLESTGKEEQRKLMEAVVAAWDAGIVVLTAAGNNGPEKKTVTVPGTVREVITVGSQDDEGNAEYRIGLKRGYSSWGPTDACIVKPELLAPGSNIRSCSNNGGYTIKTGTSMAVPVLSGIVALLLQQDTTLDPVDVKLRFYQRCMTERSDIVKGCLGRVYVPYLLN